MARNKKITKSKFRKLKQLSAMGMKAKAVSEFLKISLTTVYVCRRDNMDSLETYQEYNRKRLAKARPTKKIIYPKPVEPVEEISQKVFQVETLKALDSILQTQITIFEELTRPNQ